ncbi:hypothetical protein vseg_011152 [Gypsophila vaccaria]
MPDDDEAVVTTILPTDPLYFNPSEGTLTLKITSILTGIENYGPWKRQMELALSAKRKLGYVTGGVTKPKSDEVKQEAWDASNNLVISWILQNVSERIKLVIMYGETAKDIWDTLQRRYTVENGARKFKLNKECYEIEQDNRTVEEYYTQLQIVWDELENMNTLPLITQKTSEVSAYLKALNEPAEERRLFQFLNGLDKKYATLRSNVLLMSHLPTVESAVSMLLQKETQTNNSNGGKGHEASAFLSKGENDDEPCKHCGRRNHKSDMCWEVVGYPVGHPRNKRQMSRPAFKGPNNYRSQRQPGQPSSQGGYYSEQNNSKQYNAHGYRGPRKVAANAKHQHADLAMAIGTATQQLENLLKLVPGNNHH